MRLERLKIGERIASVFAIILFISMFLDWFVFEIPETTGAIFFLDGRGQSAWESLEYSQIVLVVAVVAAPIVAALRLTGVRYRSPVPVNALVATLGLLSALLILYRIVDPPSVGGSFEGFMGNVSAERTVQFGIFLGLLGAVGICFGACRAAMQEGSSSDPRE